MLPLEIANYVGEIRIWVGTLLVDLPHHKQAREQTKGLEN